MTEFHVLLNGNLTTEKRKRERKGSEREREQTFYCFPSSTSIRPPLRFPELTFITLQTCSVPLGDYNQSRHRRPHRRVKTLCGYLRAGARAQRFSKFNACVPCQRKGLRKKKQARKKRDIKQLPP